MGDTAFEKKKIKNVSRTYLALQVHAHETVFSLGQAQALSLWPRCLVPFYLSVLSIFFLSFD